MSRLIARLCCVWIPLFGLLVGCSEHDSYLLVSAYSDMEPIDKVAQLRVHASVDDKQDLLHYPRMATGNFRLDPSTPITFSIGFSEAYKGSALIEVEALATNGESLGYGRATTTLLAGDTTRLEIRLFPSAIRVTSAGGTSALSCSPMNPAATCGPDRTCSLMSCLPGEHQEGICYPAGQGQPGAICVRNSDCPVGSQCFSFTPTCAARTCLRYCLTDSDCNETGSRCDTVLSCGVRLCSRPCDPTGEGRTGCAPGLVCFIYTGESTDCSCEELREKGSVGAVCTSDEQCGPGMVCVLPRGTCNPVCDRTTAVCPTGLTCTPLTGYKKFGACL